jgi:hypothetical protein
VLITSRPLHIALPSDHEASIAFFFIELGDSAGTQSALGMSTDVAMGDVSKGDKATKEVRL